MIKYLFSTVYIFTYTSVNFKIKRIKLYQNRWNLLYFFIPQLLSSLWVFDICSIVCTMFLIESLLQISTFLFFRIQHTERVHAPNRLFLRLIKFLLLLSDTCSILFFVNLWPNKREDYLSSYSIHTQILKDLNLIHEIENFQFDRFKFQ